MRMASIDSSRLETMRRAQGLSQRTVAELAGITRQAVGAIEKGRMQPSVGIALGLARALGTSVEHLFGSKRELTPKPARTAFAAIGGRTVSYELDADHLAIEPAESPVPGVFLGGCDLSAGLLSRHAMMRSRDVRVLWLTMTNRGALRALMGGKLHAAVVHGPLSPDETRSIGDFLRFEVAGTEAGWLIERSNPLHLLGAVSLPRSKARLANRPAGAGARRLLDEELRRAAIDPARIAGYDREFHGQLDVGRAISQGFADAAVGMASVASVFHLGFIPLRAERCALLVPPRTLRTPEIRALLDALRSTSYRRDLEAFNSYDVTRTGESIT
jgi:molybdate-binding protein/DNA-binding XRE family transcriptional regulator